LLDTASGPISQPDRRVAGESQQRSAACDGHAEARDNSQQDHVAVFFANPHAGKTRQSGSSSGNARQMTARDRSRVSD